MTKTEKTEFGENLSHYIEAQVAEEAEENKDLDACIDLWRTVIERAVSDLQYLQDKEGREDLKKHELEKLRRIRESPPQDFIKGPWFEQICEYLNVDVDRLRTGLNEYLSKAA